MLKLQLPRVSKDVTGVSLDPERFADFTTGTLKVNPVCYKKERFFRVRNLRNFNEIHTQAQI